MVQEVIKIKVLNGLYKPNQTVYLQLRKDDPEGYKHDKIITIDTYKEARIIEIIVTSELTKKDLKNMFFFDMKLETEGEKEIIYLNDPIVLDIQPDFEFYLEEINNKNTSL